MTWRDFREKIKFLFGTIASKPTEERQQRVPAAQEAVKTNQLSLRAAGEQYGLPKSTVHRHVLSEDMKVGAGRPTTLSEEEERGIGLVTATCV